MKPPLARRKLAYAAGMQARRGAPNGRSAPPTAAAPASGLVGGRDRGFRPRAPGAVVGFIDCASTLGRPGASSAVALLHRYATIMYSHSVTTFRPISAPSNLPPVSGLARR